MLHSLGYTIALIETDPNFTLSTLRKMEIFRSGAKDSSIFKVLGAEEKQISEDIATLSKTHKPALDFIIVDSAGKSTDEHIKTLCLASDLIIVPTSLTQNDLLVTYQTIQDLKPAVLAKKGLQILVLPNRIHSRTSSVTVQKTLANLEVSVLEQFVPQRNTFAEFSTILPEKSYQPIVKQILAFIQ
jgi:chromosome partitioning protein